MRYSDEISPVDLLILRKLEIDRYIGRLKGVSDANPFKLKYINKSKEYALAIDIIKGSAKLAKPDQITKTDEK